MNSELSRGLYTLKVLHSTGQFYFEKKSTNSIEGDTEKDARDLIQLMHAYIELTKKDVLQ